MNVILASVAPRSVQSWGGARIPTVWDTSIVDRFSRLPVSGARVIYAGERLDEWTQLAMVRDLTAFLLTPTHPAHPRRSWIEPDTLLTDRNGMLHASSNGSIFLRVEKEGYIPRLISWPDELIRAEWGCPCEMDTLWIEPTRPTRRKP